MACKAKKTGKKIGVVTHYYTGLGVGIVKLAGQLKVGDKLKFKGGTSDFEQEVSEMQFDHKEIKAGKKGQEVGIKVKDKVREGDEVFLAE